MNPIPRRSLTMVPMETRKAKLAKARTMLHAGYGAKVVEKRVGSSMKTLRQWAQELEFKLEG